MKRVLVALALLVAPLLILATPAAAQTDVFEQICRENPAAEVCQEKERSKSQTSTNNAAFGPNGILTRAAQIVTLIVGITSVIMVIIGGLKYAMSAGDSSKMSTAKNAIIYALVGLFIAVLAQSIIIFVLRRI